MPSDRKMVNAIWEQLARLFPEASFNFYADTDNVSQHLSTYVPILRPYILWKYFTDHPEISKDAVFYCDCDILFTKNFNVDELIEDDICYLSDTNSYINANYFKNKIRDVLPNRLSKYRTRDILNEVATDVGISRKICELHNNDSGGAQYLLKNIDADFWWKVMNDCLIIKNHLSKANEQFFANEDKGFQSWCSDMWAVLWNLWLKDLKTKIVPEMDFAWANDPITKLDTVGILHNAGVTDNWIDDHPCFFKEKYIHKQHPFSDNQIDIVLAHKESKKYCTWYYSKALKEIYESTLFYHQLQPA